MKAISYDPSFFPTDEGPQNLQEILVQNFCLEILTNSVAYFDAKLEVSSEFLPIIIKILRQTGEWHKNITLKLRS